MRRVHALQQGWVAATQKSRTTRTPPSTRWLGRQERSEAARQAPAGFHQARRRLAATSPRTGTWRPWDPRTTVHAAQACSISLQPLLGPHIEQRQEAKQQVVEDDQRLVNPNQELGRRSLYRDLRPDSMGNPEESHKLVKMRKSTANRRAYGRNCCHTSSQNTGDSCVVLAMPR